MSTTLIETLIVDDEAPARELLRDLLADDPQIRLVGECATARKALAAINELHPQLLFLDIRMPGLSGIELAGLIGNAQETQIVFVTAFDRYAVDAFGVRALDYLLKPISKDRLQACLQRVKRHLHTIELSRLSERVLQLTQQFDPGPSLADEKWPQEIIVRRGTRLRAIPVADIICIQSANQYVTIYSALGADLLSGSMNSIQRRLDPQQFVRLHRSVIVNVRAVREVRTGSNGAHVVVTRDGRKLSVSRYRREVVPLLLRALSRNCNLSNYNNV